MGGFDDHFVDFEQQMFRYIIGLQISLLGLKGLWGELPRVEEGGGPPPPAAEGRGGGRSSLQSIIYIYLYKFIYIYKHFDRKT